MNLSERTLNLGLEWVIVVCGLLYLWLIIREKRSGWLFGITASLLSVWLFIRLNLLAESALYVYYVLAGLYGYFHWKYGNRTGKQLLITTRPISTHVGILVIGALGTVLLAQGLAALGSQMVYIDAATTVFSFIATWMVAQKILENWIYWIFIDAVSVWLYSARGANIYAAQMGLYTVFAIVGLVVWIRTMKHQRNLSSGTTE